MSIATETCIYALYIFDDGLGQLGRYSGSLRAVRSRDRIPPGAWMFVLCVVSKRNMQYNQDNETSTEAVESTREFKRNPCGGDIFRTRPDHLGPTQPPTPGVGNRLVLLCRNNVPQSLSVPTKAHHIFIYNNHWNTLTWSCINMFAVH
jgi:hypothetical protein